MSTFAKFTPTGTINGVNPTFTVVALPSSAELYKNGQLQTDGGADYTLTLGTSTSTTTGTATTTITATFSFAPASIPQSGDTLTAWVFTQ